MHFVNLSRTEVATVLVEVNVRGLLAMHARRLCKSKRAMATVSSGTVRIALATPDSRELAHKVWLREHGEEAAQQGLLNMIDRLTTENALLRKALKDAPPAP